MSEETTKTTETEETIKNVVYEEQTEVLGDTVIKTKTPDRIIPIVESYNIPETKRRKEKAQRAIEKWQAIVDECDEILSNVTK